MSDLRLAKALAAVECCTLDIAEFSASLARAATSYRALDRTLVNLSAAVECSALDEIEDLEGLDPPA